MLTMKDIIDDHNKKIREVSKEVSLPLNEEDRNLLLKMHEFLVNSQDPEISEKYDFRKMKNQGNGSDESASGNFF